MLKLTGYQVQRKLAENDRFQWHRVYREADGKSFISKTRAGGFVDARTSARFHYEWDMLSRLSELGLTAACFLEYIDGEPVILFQNVDGEPMSALLKPARWSGLGVDYLLHAAIALTERLTQLHGAQAVLCALHPASLFYEEFSGQMHIMDASLCVSLSVQDTVRLTDDMMPDDGIYMSPRLVNGTTRVPDAAVDIHSLGIVLYEWFTGSNPFASNRDTLFRHQMTSLEAPHLVNRQLPEMLSRIIEKCMYGSDDVTYNDIIDVRYDLIHCMKEWQLKGEISVFELSGLGLEERTAYHLRQLHGRWKERDWLLNEIGHEARKSPGVLVLTGESGIGKTMLMVEVLRQRAEATGSCYGYGAFKEQQLESPYQIWLTIMDDLLAQVLKLSFIQVEVWRLRLLEALQESAGVLTPHIRSLTALVGVPPPVPSLSADGAQRRFIYLLNRLFQLFMQQENPLVLALDDVQWADQSSLQYLIQLLQDDDTDNLVVLASCRGESLRAELPPSWEQSLAGLRLPINRLHLQEWSHAEFVQMLQDVLGGRVEQREQFTEWLWQHTTGRPLLVGQVLQDALRQGVLRFERKQNVWIWERSGLQTLLLRTKDYVVDKLSGQPASTMRLLGAAAVAGNGCEWGTLEALTGISEQESNDILSSAVEAYLLVMERADGLTRYHFAHDRIRQAVYSYLEPQLRLDLHERMGTLLLDRISTGNEVNAFEVASHWNLVSAERIIREDERLLLIRLNLAAGLEEARTYAYADAMSWWDRALQHVRETDWESHSELLYRLYGEQAEAAFLCAREQQAIAAYEVLMTHANNKHEKVRAILGRIRLEIGYGRQEQAILLCERALDLIHPGYCLRSSKGQLGLQWLRIQRLLWRMDIDDIQKLPSLIDENKRLIIQVLAQSVEAYFVADKAGWAAAAFTILELTLTDGYMPEAVIGYVSYAVFNHYTNRYADSYKWGKIALEASSDFPELHIRVQSAFALCYDSWRQFEPGLMHRLVSISTGMSIETGNLRDVNINVIFLAVMLLAEGQPLSQIYSQLKRREHELSRLNNDWQIWSATGIVALIVRLTGERDDEERFPVEEFNRRQLTGESFGTDDPLIREIGHYYVYLIGFLFGQYEEALLALERSVYSERLHKSNNSINPVHIFFKALVLIRIYELQSPDEQKTCLIQIRRLIRELRRGARQVPARHTHKWMLLRAETARMKRKFRLAEALYEQALELATQNGFIHDVAIIAECYGLYGLQRKQMHVARHFLTEACHAYEQWGAMAKVRDMERKYEQFLHRRHPSGLGESDMMALIEAGYSLSGTLEVEALFNGLLQMMIHHTGADYGAIVLCDDQRRKHTLGAYGGRDDFRMEMKRMEESDVVPVTLIGYAIETRNPLVLDHPNQEDAVFHHAYVGRKKLKSLLCLPIMTQHKLEAILYLESSEASYLFTLRKQEVLRWLGMQWVMALSNARLYADVQEMQRNLERQVEQRTHELEQSIRDTSAALVEVSIYEERHRIAQEVHDVVGHTLTSVVLQMEASKRLLSRDKEEGLERLQQAQELARSGLDEIRHAMHLLREDRYADLSGILHELIEATERNAGVVIHVRMSPLRSHFPIAVKKVIYYALQEGLTNGIRHGQSTIFHFSLDESEDEGRVRFGLTDNGCGLRSAAPGFGLRGMRERVGQLGGTLSIANREEGGCLLQFSIPRVAIRNL